MFRKKLFKLKSDSSSQTNISNPNIANSKSNRKLLSKSKSANTLQTNFEASNQGQKHRAVITQLLSMTLTRDLETDLLWIVAKGFDLPLVIGEQFICKTNKFQSASYHACLEFTLTTLWNKPFSQEIWSFLLSRLHDIEKCALAMTGLERKTRIYHLKKYANCFVGREAVSWLLDYNFVSRREDAVNLGGIWEDIGLIDHVTSAHYFKDEGLYYIFDEELIHSKCTLIKQGRKSKSKDKYNFYGNVGSPKLDNMHSSNGNIATIVENKSNSKSSKRGSNKRKSKKKLRKQKSKSRSKDRDKVGTPKSKKSNPNLMYGFSSNSHIEKDKSIKDLKLNEWSDSDKEYGDVFSDSDLNSPSNNYNQRSPRGGKHSKKRSISLPWFGSNS